MEAVKVKKEELLAVMAKNREQHRTVFLEACDGYRKAVIAELDKRLTDARAGTMVTTYVALTQPKDMTPSYDRAIAMVSMSVDSLVTLTEREFSSYVLDQWDWQHQFLTTMGSYSTLAASVHASYYS